MATKALDKFELLQQARIARNREKLRQLLSYLVNQIVFLEGKKGKGKTLSATAITWYLREYFNKPVVVIGSKMGLNENYGKFIFLDEKQFIQELDKIATLAKNTPDGVVKETVDQALKNIGIDIMNATLVFDEAYKLFDARTPSDKLVRVFGYFVAQSRHYNITILIISPDRKDIDRRVRRQIDWFGRASTTCKTFEGKCVRPRCPHVTTVRFIGGIDRFKFKIYGPNFWDKYDSWAKVGFRASHLKMGEM